MVFFRAQRSVGVEGLAVGDAAPDFALMDQDGEVRQLGDYQGQWLVLYFYPKDDTPGCTTEACRFRDSVLQLRQLEAEVLGISLDSHERHKAFAVKHRLPFPLLADPNGAVAWAYGAYLGLGPVRFAKRHTFLIDPNSCIAHIFRSVAPRSHSEEVVGMLEALQAERS